MARYKGKKNSSKFLVEKPEGNRPLEDGGIILESVLKKYDRGELFDSSRSEY
jgi:hypothetical protein